MDSNSYYGRTSEALCWFGNQKDVLLLLVPPLVLRTVKPGPLPYGSRQTFSLSCEVLDSGVHCFLTDCKGGLF